MWPFGRKKKEAGDIPYCAAVIVAAGSATRMQGIDKAMAPLGLEPVIVHAVRPFQWSKRVREIVVVTREDLIVPIGQALQDAGMDKVTMVVAGGASRAESVIIGLDTASITPVLQTAPRSLPCRPRRYLIGTCCAVRCKRRGRIRQR